MMNPHQSLLNNDIQNFRSYQRINKINRTFENNNDDSIEKLRREYNDFLKSDRKNTSQQQYPPSMQDQPLDRSRNFSNSNNSRIQLKNLMRSEPVSENGRYQYENPSPQRSSHLAQSSHIPPYGFNPELNSYRAPSRSSSFNQETQSAGNVQSSHQYPQDMYSPAKNYSSAYQSKLQYLEKKMFTQPHQYPHYQHNPTVSNNSELPTEYQQNTVPIIIEKPVFIEKKIYIEKPVYIEKEIEIPVYKPVYKEIRQEYTIPIPQTERKALNHVDSSNSVLQQSINKSPLKRQHTIENTKAASPLLPSQITRSTNETTQPERSKKLPVIPPQLLKKAKFEGLGFVFEATKTSLQNILNCNKDFSQALTENQHSENVVSKDDLQETLAAIKQLSLELMEDLAKNISAASFTQNLKEFIKIYTMEEVIPCQQFHLLFEIRRFQFNRQHNIVGKTYQRDNLILSTFFIIRVVINQLLLRYKKFNMSFSDNSLTFNNAKIIGSIFYHLIRHNLQYNNQKQNIYNCKLQPLSGNFLLSQDELEKIAEKVPSLYGEDQMIYGMYAQSEVQEIINDDKFLRKFYQFHEQFIKKILQLSKD